MKNIRFYTFAAVLLTASPLLAQGTEDPARNAVMKAFAVAGIQDPSPQEVAAFSTGLNPGNVPIMAQAVTMYVQSKTDVDCFQKSYRTGMSIDDVRKVCPARK